MITCQLPAPPLPRFFSLSVYLSRRNAARAAGMPPPLAAEAAASHSVLPQVGCISSHLTETSVFTYPCYLHIWESDRASWLFAEEGFLTHMSLPTTQARRSAVPGFVFARSIPKRLIFYVTALYKHVFCSHHEQKWKKYEPICLLYLVNNIFIIRVVQLKVYMFCKTQI